MKNAEVADLLQRMSILSEAAGEERFKSIAYWRAANTIRNLTEDIEVVWKQGKLTDLPYVGEGIAKKIDEYLSTGHSTYLDKMQKKVPAAVFSLMAVPGIGPKTAYRLAKEAGVSSLEDLEKRLEEGMLLEILGKENSRKILEEIKKFKSRERRLLLPEAEAVIESLQSHFTTKAVQVMVAGSYRRGKETIGDIDLISTDQLAADALARFPRVGEVIERGNKRMSVKLVDGLQVDLRLFDQDELGAGLLYFTGSKEHNIELRNIAIKRGWKLNEYGLFDTKTGKRLAAKTEDDIYSELGLAYIPPELRENRGEIEAALAKRLPLLVEQKDLVGDLQMHSNWSDGQNTIKEMATAAKSLGYSYIAITDHSLTARIANGLSEERFKRQWKEIEKLNEELYPFRILKGAEVEIRGNGELDFPSEFLKEFDVVGASIHQGYRQSPEKLTERVLKALNNPEVNYLCHPTNRLIGQREGHKIDLAKVIRAAKENGKWIEINAQPNRLDLNDFWAREAAKEGVKLLVNSDAHSTGELQNMKYGVLVARRAWLEKNHVVNTLSLKELTRLL
ncbi:MAG: DNA polymerase/3'-5' exonuclease PolX [Conexivisphaerales archaeon]